MIGLRVRSEGLFGLSAELLKETAADVRPLIARAAERLERRMRGKLSVPNGPSQPGDPPAVDQGALRDSIGRTGPFTRPGSVAAAVGVGVGDEATRRVAEWKSRGVNVFEYADLHENGGMGGVGGSVRYPARSYARSAEAELEASIVSDWERGL